MLIKTESECNEATCLSFQMFQKNYNFTNQITCGSELFLKMVSLEQTLLIRREALYFHYSRL